MAELKAINVHKAFPTRGEPLMVLRDINLDLVGDDSVAILGPSGSGKSTLLHILGTLDRPTSGRVLLDGQNPFSYSEPDLAAFRNQKIGFVFQDHHLLPQCTVLENVLIPVLAAGRATTQDRDRARELLARVGLAERLEHRPAELSGGEKQRAALARALIRRPVALLADEPTGNLDRGTASAVGQLLVEVQRETKSLLVVVTHSLELAGLMKRRLELNEGRLVPE
jgi:lipoprotein-releasing system ATP-binding protein